MSKLKKQKILTASILALFTISTATALYFVLNQTTNNTNTAKQDTNNCTGNVTLYTSTPTIYLNQQDNYPTLYVDTKYYANNSSVLLTLPKIPLTYTWYENSQVIATTTTNALNLNATFFLHQLVANKYTFSVKITNTNKNDTTINLNSNLTSIKVIADPVLQVTNGSILANNQASTVLAPFFSNENPNTYKQVIQAGSIKNKNVKNIKYTWYIKNTNNSTFTNLTTNTSNALFITNDLFTTFGYYQIYYSINATLDNGAPYQTYNSNLFTINYVKTGDIGISTNTNMLTNYALVNHQSILTPYTITASTNNTLIKNTNVNYTFTWYLVSADGKEKIKQIEQSTNTTNTSTLNFNTSALSAYFIIPATYYFACYITGTYLGSTLESTWSPIYTLIVIKPTITTNTTTSTTYLPKSASVTKNLPDTLTPTFTLKNLANYHPTITYMWQIDFNGQNLITKKNIDTINPRDYISTNVTGIYTITCLVSFDVLGNTSYFAPITYTYNYYIITDPTLNITSKNKTSFNYIANSNIKLANLNVLLDLTQTKYLNSNLTWNVKLVNHTTNKTTNFTFNQNITANNTNTNTYTFLFNTMQELSAIFNKINIATNYSLFITCTDSIDDLIFNSNTLTFTYHVYPAPTFNNQITYTINNKNINLINHTWTGFLGITDSLINTSINIMPTNTIYSPNNLYAPTFSYIINATDTNTGNVYTLDPTYGVYSNYYNTTNQSINLTSSMLSTLTQAGVYNLTCLVTYSIDGITQSFTLHLYTLNLLQAPSITLNSNLTNSTIGYNQTSDILSFYYFNNQFAPDKSGWLNKPSTINPTLNIKKIKNNTFSNLTYSYTWTYQFENGQIQDNHTLTQITPGVTNLTLDFNTIFNTIKQFNTGTQFNTNKSTLVVFMSYTYDNTKITFAVPVTNSTIISQFIELTLTSKKDPTTNTFTTNLTTSTTNINGLIINTNYSNINLTNHTATLNHLNLDWCNKATNNVINGNEYIVHFGLSKYQNKLQSNKALYIGNIHDGGAHYWHVEGPWGAGGGGYWYSRVYMTYNLNSVNNFIWSKINKQYSYEAVRPHMYDKFYYLHNSALYYNSANLTFSMTFNITFKINKQTFTYQVPLTTSATYHQTLRIYPN